MPLKLINSHGQQKDGCGRRFPMINTSRNRSLALIALMIPAAALGACTTQQTASQPEPQISVTSVPPQRSYLDPGPMPSRNGAPNYVQAGQGSFARQTDGFGNDVVRQIP